MTTPNVPYNAPRLVEGKWRTLDYVWWYLGEDRITAVVYRTASPKPVPLATIGPNPGPESLLVASTDDGPVYAGDGVAYLAKLVAMLDYADRVGTEMGHHRAAIGLGANVTTDTVATLRECVDLAGDPDAWAEKFGLRTAPVQDEDLVAQVSELVGFTDDELDRLGVPDETQGAVQAHLLTAWDVAYQAAYGQGAVRIATTLLRARDARSALGVSRVADWVCANLEAGDALEDAPTPRSEFVRLGDDQVVMHLPYGRSFEIKIREITGEVDRG